MKKLMTTLFAFVAFVTVAIAQSPQDIISRMEAEMSKHENEGFAMTVDARVMLLGTMTTRTYALGNKTRSDASMMGMDIITWTDGETMWVYDHDSNEVEIQKHPLGRSAAEDSDIKMFEGVTEGYNVSIDKETDRAWYLYCKKMKSNTDEDLPKKMDLVIEKGTYMPISLSTKMQGVRITIYDISYGVSEQQVTFNPADYPGVTINDKR